MSQSGHERLGLVVLVLDQWLPGDVVLTLRKVTEISAAPWPEPGWLDGAVRGTCTRGGLKPML